MIRAVAVAGATVAVAVPPAAAAPDAPVTANGPTLAVRAARVPAAVPVPGRTRGQHRASRSSGRPRHAGQLHLGGRGGRGAGGMIRFACGPKPVAITMKATAKVLNTRSRVVLDGGALVTLSGQGRRRILYMDTCDRAQVWATSHRDDQARPELVVQNISFARENSTGQHLDGGVGGAIFDRGGRLRVVDSTFTGNRCDHYGPISAARHPRAVSVPRPARPGSPGVAAAARSTTTATG